MKIEIDINNDSPFITIDKRLVSWKDGIMAIRKENKWSRRDLAKRMCVSTRTLEGYEQGRKPGNMPMFLLSYII